MAGFSNEAKKDKVANLHAWKTCKCAGVNSPQLLSHTCQCHNHESVSPLFQVHWKRLVIDEGHVASNSTSSMVTLAKKLGVESKWIVTGTPTSEILTTTLLIYLGRLTDKDYSSQSDGPKVW